MPREFNVPTFYRSEFVHSIKQERAGADPKKRDRAPSVLDYGKVKIKLARHFGFCFGVENAIEIAYRVIEENPDKRIFLLSEVIHNHQVNEDLQERGIRFLMKTDGTQLVDFDTLTPEDIVIVPAFGTTVEMQKKLTNIGIDPYKYDATCPFVEKVWKRAAKLGSQDFTVVVHGKRSHEETRATFSHSYQTAPTLIVLDIEDALFCIDYMKGKKTLSEFSKRFSKSMSDGFDPEKHLKRIGVVNQTTMLASDTKEIAAAFKSAMLEIYGEHELEKHFADTRDTLCYATYENQSATAALTESGAEIALVVGGYNSSNTSHLVELCETKMPTYYIRDAKELISENEVRHFDMNAKEIKISKAWLPSASETAPLTVAVTAGASCPDYAVDLVIQRVLELLDVSPNARHS